MVEQVRRAKWPPPALIFYVSMSGEERLAQDEAKLGGLVRLV